MTVCKQDFQLAALSHYTLQNKLLKTLPADQDLIHVRSERDWFDVLNSSDKKVISIHDEADNLTAHAVVLLPNSCSSEADMLNFELPDVPEKVTTLTSVMSDPDLPRRGMMKKMISEWFSVGVESNRDHFLAMVTTTNVASWSQFINAGLSIVGADYDDSDGSNIFYVQGPLDDYFDVGIEHTERVLSPDASLSEMRTLFSEGWVGTRGERSEVGNYTGNLILTLTNG
jgi:hypothetical protein